MLPVPMLGNSCLAMKAALLSVPVPRLNSVSVWMKLLYECPFLSVCELGEIPAVESINQRYENEFGASSPRVCQMEFIWGDNLLMRLKKDSKCFRG